MKKGVIIFSCLVLINAPAMVSAQGSQNGQAVQQQDRIQDPATHSLSVTPQGYQVQNQNQINTQNQGEDSQLQVNTGEQEQLGQGQGEGLQTRSQNTVQNMSNVAVQVQQLLQVRTEGGIGDQVRQIAQAQNQAQSQIQEQLNKLEAKGKIARFFTGTDYGAVKNLKQQLEQNQLRIQQLSQLQIQLTNQEDTNMVRETIQALIRENTSLQERINAEEQTQSMFGWLFKFFNK